MKRVLPIVVLLTAKSISDVGFALDFVCLGVFVWVRTGSALATSLAGLCLYAGGVAGGRLGQRFAATWNRRRAMITADLARAGALLVLTLAPGRTQLWWLFPTVVVIGCGRSVFEATLSAATPALVGPARSQAMNSAIAALKGVALLLGMGLATIAVPTIGFRGVFGLDAASYALSASVLVALPLRMRDASGTPAGPVPHRGRARMAMAMGVGLAALIAVRGLDAFGSASHQVGLPLLGSVREPANPAAIVGLVWMAWAGGTLAGSLLLRPMLARQITTMPSAVFGVATMVMSAGFIAVFWVGPLVAMLLVAIVAGLGDALSEITFKQALQALPDARRGSAFGTAQIGVNVGFAVGLLAVGAVATPARMPTLVLGMHGIAMVAALGLTVWTLTNLVGEVAPAAGGGDRSMITAMPVASAEAD